MAGTGSKPKDITGNSYGRLVAKERLERSNTAGYYWRCLCECGNFAKVAITRLTSGKTISCGCAQIDITRKLHTKHGMYGTKEYKSWQKVRERCLSPSCKEYSRYGAVGVKIQDSWVDFSTFLAYMGRMPTDNLRYTLDRIDNNKGYEEGNVRWATYHQQARNKTFQANNTSGVNVVLWDNKLHPNGMTSTLYAKAVWYTLDGKQARKFFSTKKLGILPAFKLACDYREKMIAQLNAQGAGYSEKHGKAKETT